MTPPSTKARWVAILVSLATVTTIVAVPTSVLADSKAANGHQDVTSSPGLNQLTTDDDAAYGDDKPGPSNPQKRGVNPLLYREAELRNDFSGNSIPQSGIWEDGIEAGPGMPIYPMELFDAVDPGPPERPGGGHQRTYDVLQSLLNARPAAPQYQPLLMTGPAGAFPALRLHGGHQYAERKKRTLPAAMGGKSHSHLMRLKRNSGKLSPAEVFSLLALMDSRDPYRPVLPALSDYAPDSPNDLLAYAPNGLYSDVPLPMALEQLLGGGRAGGGGGPMPSDGFAYEDAGEWMNSWTDPSVDYMGLPMADLDALGALNDGKSFGPVNGYLPQKRFMVAKKKRSAPKPGKMVPVAGCKAGDEACGSYRHGTIQAAA